MTNNKFVYFLGNSMYITVTNLCTSKCVFCIKNLNDAIENYNPWIKEEEATSENIIEEIKNNNPQNYKEIVFCGYGEPLIKIDIIKNVANFIKENYPNIPIRINTNGHANLIHKRNIVPELAGIIDQISISLNAENAEKYKEITQTKFEKNKAFEAVKDFIKECVKNNIETTASVVSGFKNYEIDIEECKKITESLGAKFRVREWLEEGYTES